MQENHMRLHKLVQRLGLMLQHIEPLGVIMTVKDIEINRDAIAVGNTGTAPLASVFPQLTDMVYPDHMRLQVLWNERTQMRLRLDSTEPHLYPFYISFFIDFNDPASGMVPRIDAIIYRITRNAYVEDPNILVSLRFQIQSLDKMRVLLKDFIDILKITELDLPPPTTQGGTQQYNYWHPHIPEEDRLKNLKMRKLEALRDRVNKWLTRQEQERQQAVIDMQRKKYKLDIVNFIQQCNNDDDKDFLDNVYDALTKARSNQTTEGATKRSRTGS